MINCAYGMFCCMMKESAVGASHDAKGLIPTAGSPQIPLPVSRIVPSPSRATRKSLAINNSPLRPAVSPPPFSDVFVGMRLFIFTSPAGEHVPT